MREILFRGKRLDGGGMVEGDLLCRSKLAAIMTNSGAKLYTIDPATVGQYTELNDKIRKGDCGL